MEVARNRRPQEADALHQEEAARELRLCTSCGRSIDIDANLCQYCGRDFRLMHPQVQARPDTEENVIIYLMSVLVPLLGIIAGLYLISRQNESDRQTGKVCLAIGVVVLIVEVLVVLGLALLSAG
jgi:uncharacterized membrane protein YvbJ